MTPAATLVGVALAALLLGGCVGAAYTKQAEAKFPPTGRFVDVGGRTLHVTEAGSGPDVVLVHGAAARAADILPQMQAVLGGDAHLIAPDRAGAGWSERFRGRPRLERHAADLAALIDAEGLDRPVVVGHSYGAAVALRLALDHPDKVGALVLLGPASHGDVGPVAAYNRAATTPVLGPILNQFVVPLYGPRAASGGVEGSFAPNPAPADYAETSQQALLFRPASFHANASDMSIVNDELLAQQARYSEITIPVAIVAGQDDTVVDTQRHAGRLAKALPNARLIILPGVGHMPHFAAPDVVAGQVRAMMEKADARR